MEHSSQPLRLGQWITVCTMSLSFFLYLSETHSQTMMWTVPGKKKGKPPVDPSLCRERLCGFEKLVCC